MNQYLAKHPKDPYLIWTDQSGNNEIERAYLLGSDSPESRLRECDKHQLNLLHGMGVNTITATLFGGDAKEVHPFVQRGGDWIIDRAVVERWRDYLLHWHNLGPQQVCALMLSEWENHKEIPKEKRRAFWKAMVAAFYDLNVIWYFEEIPIGPDESIEPQEWDTEMWFLRGEMPDHHLIGLHNPTHQKHNDPWQWYVGKGLVDIAMLQCPLDEVDEWTKRQTDRGFAVIASEVSVPYGFNPGSVNEFEMWCRTPGLSGAFAFLGSVDQSPVNQEDYRLLYERVGRPFYVSDIVPNNALYWRRAPWTTGTVDGTLSLIVEPGQMASIETRSFIREGGAGWPVARFVVEGGPVEVRFRFITQDNHTVQATGVFATGTHELNFGTTNVDPVAISLDALNFIPNAKKAVVRLLEIG